MWARADWHTKLTGDNPSERLSCGLVSVLSGCLCVCVCDDGGGGGGGGVENVLCTTAFTRLGLTIENEWIAVMWLRTVQHCTLRVGICGSCGQAGIYLRLRPGPLAKLAADIPIKCLAAWLPENPLESPKSMPRLFPALDGTKVYTISWVCLHCAIIHLPTCWHGLIICNCIAITICLWNRFQSLLSLLLVLLLGPSLCSLN